MLGLCTSPWLAGGRCGESFGLGIITLCPGSNSEWLLDTAIHESLILSPTIYNMNELDKVIAKILPSLKVL